MTSIASLFILISLAPSPQRGHIYLADECCQETEYRLLWIKQESSVVTFIPNPRVLSPLLPSECWWPSNLDDHIWRTVATLLACVVPQTMWSVAFFSFLSLQLCLNLRKQYMSTRLCFWYLLCNLFCHIAWSSNKHTIIILIDFF